MAIRQGVARCLTLPMVALLKPRVRLDDVLSTPFPPEISKTIAWPLYCSCKVPKSVLQAELSPLLDLSLLPLLSLLWHPSVFLKNFAHEY